MQSLLWLISKHTVGWETSHPSDHPTAFLCTCSRLNILLACGEAALQTLIWRSLILLDDITSTHCKEMLLHPQSLLAFFTPTQHHWLLLLWTMNSPHLSPSLSPGRDIPGKFLLLLKQQVPSVWLCTLPLNLTLITPVTKSLQLL